MAQEIDLDIQLEVVRSRCTIMAAEKKLRRSKYQRRPLTDSEITTALEQKAYFLGRSLKAAVNPFEGWEKHQCADRLARSFQIGRGISSGNHADGQNGPH